MKVASEGEVITEGDLGAEAAAYARALHRRDLSPNTIASYLSALHELAGFLAARGYPTDVRRIEPRHVDEWAVELLERHRPASARNRFEAARRFFKRYGEGDRSFTSPVRTTRAPRRPEYRRAIDAGGLEDLVRACEGTAFEDRRDAALVRVFFDTGALRAELADLRYSTADPAESDVDLARGTVRVTGQGGKERIFKLEKETVRALAEYLAARRAHPHADLPWLWLDRRGHLTDGATGRALRKRGLRAGIADLHRLGHGLWVVRPAGRQPR